MIDEKFRRYEPFFGKWFIEKELGRGSFGQVLEIYWDDEFGNRTRSALKVMHIPTEEALRAQLEAQPNPAAARRFFWRQIERIKDEIQILQSCKGQSHIVSYEDHLIAENADENGIGWDILIRMELLYPAGEYLSRPEATQYDVIRMWKDISDALVFCEEQGIIHRDIKPANILVTDQGTFKLSDFGAARKTLQDHETSTRIGTERYMAPEVYMGRKYDKRADFYSLGCVIFYWLAMKRHVFMPPYPQEVRHEDYEKAQKRRISGERIPSLPTVPGAVNRVLKRTLAFRPADRYKSARDMDRAVAGLLASCGDDLKKRRLCEPCTHAVRPLRLYRKKVSQLAAAGMLLLAGGVLLPLAFREEMNAKIMRQRTVRTEEETHMPAAEEPPTAEENKREDNTETGTEAAGYAAAEADTQAETETETEEDTETEKETETETVTETETETETEAVVLFCPDRRLQIDQRSIRTHILSEKTSDEPAAFLLITDKEGKQQTVNLSLTGMNRTVLEKYREDGKLTDKALQGYEIRQRLDIQGLADGECTAQLFGFIRNETTELLLQQAVFTKSTADILSETEAEAGSPETGYQKAPDGSLLITGSNSEYAIRLDAAAKDTAFNPGQILITARIDLKEDLLPNVFISGIDEETFLSSSVPEERGYVISLSDPCPRKDGESPIPDGTLDFSDDYNAGRILTLSIPGEYLPDGAHTIYLRFIIGTEVTVQIPVEVQIRSDVPLREDWEESIKEAWRAAFPELAQTEQAQDGQEQQG